MTETTKMNIEDIRALLTGTQVYDAQEILGKGSFGVVVKAYDLINKCFVAIKFVKAGGLISKYTEREVMNHRILYHPHVVQFRRVFNVRGYLAFVMEFVDGESLFELLKRNKRLNENYARWFFQQLIIAVDYCHKKNVNSRDIKCENILLQRSHNLSTVKLCDFGYSQRQYKDTDPKSLVGSLDYMAPEVINSRERTYDGYSCDIWSCGVVLYTMIFGRYPFAVKGVSRYNEPEKHRALLAKLIDNLEYKFPSDIKVSEGCKDLIRKCLTFTPDRIKISQILEHEWFIIGFPVEAMTMNERLLKKDKAIMHKIEKNQSHIDIKEIFEIAINGEMSIAEMDVSIEQGFEMECHNSNTLLCHKIPSASSDSGHLPQKLNSC